MWQQRMVALPALAGLVLLLGAVSAAADDSDIRLKGFAVVPGSSLSLPLADGAPPVVIDVTFGVPAVTIPVQITSSTQIKRKAGADSLLVADGDPVEIRAVVAGDLLRATRLELEDFPELQLKGVVGGLPPAGVGLPLAPGTTVDIVLTLGTSDVEVPLRLTSTTKVSEPRTLRNGDLVRPEAVIRDGNLVVTKLKPGGDDDDEDDD
jgi:hypothetical protein